MYSVYCKLSLVLTCDVSISISIRSLNTGEDGCNISIGISISILLILMFTCMFSEDMVDITINCLLIGCKSSAYAYMYANMSSLDAIAT